MITPGPTPSLERVKNSAPAVEVSWFSALCNDDYEFLGFPEKKFDSTYEHCKDIVQTADRLGYQNILLPSLFQPGQEPLPFAAAMATRTRQINQLVAVRMGEIHPPMLARHLSTIDHMSKGRLTVNIISSDLPGERLNSEARYARSNEAIKILRQCWSQKSLKFAGRFYNLEIPDTAAVKPFQKNGGPMLYFGGISPDAKALCAEHCDVFLMWPETEALMARSIREMTQLAAGHGRDIDFGLRIHVIVRDTEEKARTAAQRLLSKLDDNVGQRIKNRAQDSYSAGVLRQDALRANTTDDYIEENVWSGIGRARSGCSSAIVGDPDQVYGKIQRYIKMGFRSFIFSGYPHRDECELFAKYVLPRLKTTKLNVERERNLNSRVATQSISPMADVM